MLTQLECLLSGMGLASLAPALPPTLQELELQANSIGDGGAVVLAKGMPPQLRQLGLASKREC